MREHKRHYGIGILSALVMCLMLSVVPAQAKSALGTRTAKVVSQKTVKSDTKKTKLKKLFRYVETMNYQRKVGFRADKGWEKKYALEMLKKKKGSCYHYAAAYAFLAKKATGYPVRVCLGKTCGFNKSVWQPHAWCEVKIGGKWYICDANLDKFAADSSGKYYLKRSTGKAMKKVYKRESSVTVKF